VDESIHAVLDFYESPKVSEVANTAFYSHAGSVALAEWKKAVQADPQNFSAIYNLARTLNQLRKPEAAEYMARLQALEERHQLTDRVQQLNNFAIQAAKDNNWPQALGQLQEAIELCQQCAQLAILRKNLGLIYAQKGDLQNAKKQLELAAPLLPAGPDATAVAQLLRRLGSSSRALPQNQ
jgi:Tfp pilus assembly protein PilF